MTEDERRIAANLRQAVRDANGIIETLLSYGDECPDCGADLITHPATHFSACAIGKWLGAAPCLTS